MAVAADGAALGATRVPVAGNNLFTPAGWNDARCSPTIEDVLAVVQARALPISAPEVPDSRPMRRPPPVIGVTYSFDVLVSINTITRRSHSISGPPRGEHGLSSRRDMRSARAQIVTHILGLRRAPLSRYFTATISGFTHTERHVCAAGRLSQYTAIHPPSRKTTVRAHASFCRCFH